MADFIFKPTEEERIAVMQAIRNLNKIRHLNHMSQAMLSESSGVRPSKVRAAIGELMTEALITQYVIDEKRTVKRYYYVIEEAGNVKYPAQ